MSYRHLVAVANGREPLLATDERDLSCWRLAAPKAVEWPVGRWRDAATEGLWGMLRRDDAT
jgi:hypothetical protein